MRAQVVVVLMVCSAGCSVERDAGVEDGGGFADALQPLGPCPRTNSATHTPGRVVAWQYAREGPSMILHVGFPAGALDSPEPEPSGCIDECVVGQRYKPDASLPGDSGVPCGRLNGARTTVTGLGVGDLVIEPPSCMAYREGRAFGSGERMSIATEGADLPRFTGELVTPPEVNVGLPAQLDRMIDNAVTWSVSSTRAAGVLEIELIGRTVGPGHVDTGAVCRFPVEAGRGRIPGSLLAAIAPGTVTLRVRTVHETQVPTSSGAVTLRAEVLRPEASITLR